MMRESTCVLVASKQFTRRGCDARRNDWNSKRPHTARWLVWDVAPARLLGTVGVHRRSACAGGAGEHNIACAPARGFSGYRRHLRVYCPRTWTSGALSIHRRPGLGIFPGTACEKYGIGLSPAGTRAPRPLSTRTPPRRRLRRPAPSMRVCGKPPARTRGTDTRGILRAAVYLCTVVNRFVALNRQHRRKVTHGAVAVALLPQRLRFAIVVLSVDDLAAPETAPRVARPFDRVHAD